MPSPASLSIGEVLTTLRRDFPDISISKIRFLEAEGLVRPERTASGYRRFDPADLTRLRYVLSVQRDHYLPLRVIREHLDALDRGLEPPPLRAGAPQAPAELDGPPGLPEPADFAAAAGEMRLSAAELLGASGLAADQLAQLEQFGLLGPLPGGTHYGGDALLVARTVAQLGRYGIEARHVRSFKAAADREVGLVEQVVTPMLRSRGPEARARAEEAARELAALSVRLHTTLVRASLRARLRR